MYLQDGRDEDGVGVGQTEEGGVALGFGAFYGAGHGRVLVMAIRHVDGEMNGDERMAWP